MEQAEAGKGTGTGAQTQEQGRNNAIHTKPSSRRMEGPG